MRSRHPMVLAALVLGAIAAGTASAQPTASPNVACIAAPGGSCVPLTVHVIDSATGLPVADDFRWLIQMDRMFVHVPGQPAVPHAALPGDTGFTPHAGETLSVSSHPTYSPPIAAGEHPGGYPSLDTSKHYFVSVLPATATNLLGGYNMGGAPVVFTGGSATVTIPVTRTPTPTSQISVLVFEDRHPINNEPEVPEERGLAGFTVQVYDTGGTIGDTGGLISNDAFGHKLGTTYQIDASGNPVMNPDGTPVVVQEGSGVILTDASGEALIKYMPPGKWAVVAIPPQMPAGQEWHQTSTLEGAHDIEAFAKPNEPPVFVEFGPPGYHVFVGFTQQFNAIPAPPAGGSTVTLTGRITNNHPSRPPTYTFFSGDPIKHAWVALNDLSAGPAGEGIYAAPCDPVTGAFSIPGVPAGSKYQLVSWDDNLNDVFAFADASVPAAASGSYDMGDVPVFKWFGRLVVDFFYDTNGNGVRDPGEPGIPGQNLNIRFKDGSIYQALLTNDQGRVTFEQVFPLFNWFVTEFDFSRWGTTGLTVRVDDGGPINPNDPDSVGGMLNPQQQPTVTNPLGGRSSRYEAVSSIDGSLVATQGFQLFANETIHMEYAKHVYGVDTPSGAITAAMKNGGIAGGVWYDTTRAEDDPRYAVQELWQPGIPRVPTNLYNEDPRAKFDPNRLVNGVVSPGPNPAFHGVIADTNGNGKVDLADVDNWPFGWASGGAMGPEDVKRNGDVAGCTSSRTCAWDPGDSLQNGSSTSWDDAPPTGCVGAVFAIHGKTTDCYDGLRNFNQARDASSDGFYGFGGVNGPAAPQLPSGNYIVEAVAPPGYIHTSELSKNINFGQPYIPSPQNLPPECVGDAFTLDSSSQLDLFPGVPIRPIVAGTRHGCDRKLVIVADGQDTGADFFLYTKVPVAAVCVGVTTDDFTNEFDPAAPNFGEKYAPPSMPVSIRDWTGREIMRTYTDEFGAYNALVPSSFSANIPVPSGFDPNILQVCMNHPGPIPDPAHPGQTMTDPYFLRQYSQFCYSWTFMPGKTSYLDTPVVPVAAFTGPQQSTLDCELPNGTPKLYSVTGISNGPVVNATGDVLTIVSEGTAVPVANPMYNPSDATLYPRTVARDYGFGPCTLNASTHRCTNGAGVTIGGLPQQIYAWNTTSIQIHVTNTAGTIGELVVHRGDNGKDSVSGVTVTVGVPSGTRVLSVPQGGTIQSVIDAANPGDTVVIPPGRYNELLIMTKPVRLQGAGPGSVTIDAAKTPSRKIQDWRKRMQAFVTANPSYVLPGQPTGVQTSPSSEPTLFSTEEGPGLIVLGPSGGYNATANPNVYRRINGTPNARVDGVTFTGGDMGGAIFINGYAHYFQVTNNRIVGNSGFYHGGIRSGYPNITATGAVTGLDAYVNANNDNMTIAYNQVMENGAFGGAGGGISLCTGSTSYQVTKNWICGNFTSGNGGGVGHLGYSNNGSIDHNTIIFNQTFDQSTFPGGAGIYVGGEAAVPLVNGSTLSPGTGSVTINANLIQGNLAGAGDGGGIRAEFVNGADVATIGASNAGNKLNRLLNQGNQLHVYNNIIADNMSGLAGGGISLQDVVVADIVNNTVVNNDSSATSGGAFPGGAAARSNPLPGGVVSYAHSTTLAAAFAPYGLNPANRAAYATFSNPAPFENNIVLGARSFFAQVSLTSLTLPAPYDLTPTAANATTDLAVLGTGPASCAGGACTLNPRFSLLSSNSNVAPYNVSTGNGNTHNRFGAPAFTASYYNGARSAVSPFGTTTDVQMAVAFDEGGNFIDVRFFPLTLNDPTKAFALFGDYHIGAASAAVGNGQALNDIYNSIPTELRTDIDGQNRPAANEPAIGADQR